MIKNKIVFAGFMGAILMSAGANAATTSVATKGYVDQQVGTVQTAINNLGDTYATVESVTNAIAELDLPDTYEVLTNKVSAISASMSAEDKATKYPTVGAVLDAMPTLTDADKEAIKDLTGENGLITRVETIEKTIETLGGEGEGSVAQQIADALTDYSTTEQSNAAYQAQSTADLQIGTTGGKFRDMTAAEKAALASGITSEKVTGYDETKTTVDTLTGEGGTITELQTAIDGLNGKDGQPGKIETIETTVTQIETIVGDETSGLIADVTANSDAIAENAKAIAENAEDIAANTAEIAKKITMPADCASGNKTCVLMVADGTVSWTPVTSPVEDANAPVVGD